MGKKHIDQILVEQVQNGDKRAFDLLVGKYQHRLVNVISQFVKDQSDVLDVTQETFIKAYRAIPNFRGDSAFYTWLYRIGTNTAKNYLLSKGRKPPNTDIDSEEAENYPGQTGLQELATPENLILKNEIEHTVAEAISSLPDELRIAITLRELDGLSYDEIAEVMECPVGTVRSRIFRARDSIQNKLNPLLGD